ncbi:hypothetical protein NIES22_59120 [Calothrix brevissima NIES-22]|nr:hypothetical protein NIES22_59120 [Calothrix brevissima NIES-22]
MKLLKTLFFVGAISVLTISSLNVLMPSTAKAEVPAGRYEAQSNGQIFFYPADRTRNPVVVYNGKQRALTIVQYGGALYTAFDGGGIYRSPDGQDLGGGRSGNTTRVYPGSQTVRAMLVCQNAIFTAFSGGGIYRSIDGQNLGGGGSTTRVYGGNQLVTDMQCRTDSVVTSFSGGGVYESPDGNNLGGGGRTVRLNR